MVDTPHTFEGDLRAVMPRKTRQNHRIPDITDNPEANKLTKTTPEERRDMEALTKQVADLTKQMGGWTKHHSHGYRSGE